MPGRYSKLRELTENLPELGLMQATMKAGLSQMMGLYKDNAVGVVKAHIPAGDMFDRHKHEVVEHLIMVAGSAQILIGEEKVLLKIGDHYLVPVGAVHSFTALEDTVVIGVTVPVEEDYPDAGRDT